MDDLLKVAVTCACGEMAIPILRFIGDESITRLVCCHRCGAELAELELGGVEDV
jgi:hypothetical protein